MKTETKQQKMKMPTSGSFFNYLMSNNSSVPVAGEYATFMHYTDRSVHLVKDVSKCGKIVTMIYCQTKGIGNQMGEQKWEHIPTDQIFTLKWRYGAWYRVSYSNWDGKITYDKVRVLFGVDNYYYDWSF